VEESKDPTESYIVQLYRLFAGGDAVAEMEASFRAGGLGYGHYKQQLFESIRDYFAPMRERREQLVLDPGYVDDVLAEGARKARLQAKVVMDRVRNAIGM